MLFLGNMQAPGLILETHLQRKPVTAVCLGAGELGSSDPDPDAAAGEQPGQTLLCVATLDAVVVWKLSEVRTDRNSSAGH